MANTYTYSVASLKMADEVYPNVIKSAVINVIASNGSNQVTGQVDVYFYLAPPPAPFTDYTDVTEQEVIGWAANDPKLLMMPLQLDEQLIELTQDTVSSNFPWS